MQTKQSDKTADFRALYDRQVVRVYRLALVLLGNPADAEDVSQQVFTKAWEKQPRFRDDEHETAWFVTVTKNQCRDLAKGSYRRTRADLADAPEPWTTFSSMEDDDLWLAVRELPAKYRVPLYLHYCEGYTLRELSRILHRNESTLQTQLADARKILRNLLDPK